DVRRYNSAVSAGFWAVLQKMLAKKPDDRYATPAELLAGLKRIAADASAEQEATPRRRGDLSPSAPTALDTTPEAPEPEPERTRIPSASSRSQTTPVPESSDHL